MATTLSSEIPTHVNSRRSSTINRPLPKRDSGTADSFTVKTPEKKVPTRHSSLIPGHVDQMIQSRLGGGSGSADLTPDPGERREGFDWNAHQETEDARTNMTHYRANSRESKGPPNFTWHERDCGIIGSPKSNAVLPTPSLTRPTLSQLPEPTLARQDTSRSSISSVGRGPRRAVPDIKTFDPGQDDDKHAVEEVPKRGITKRRTLSFMLAPTSRKDESGADTSRYAQFSDLEGCNSPPNCSAKGGLKDRRGLKQTEAMKLTLPLEVPNLPPRGRAPLSDSIKLADMSRPRQRSPKTPYIYGTAHEWNVADHIGGSGVDVHTAPVDSEPGRVGFPKNNQFDTSFAPPRRKPRDRCYITLPRRSQSGNRSGRSDSSLGRTPDGATSTPSEPVVKPMVDPTEELKQLGNKRSKRWRWSGPWTSNDLAESNPPTPEVSDRQPGVSRFFKRKASAGKTTPIATTSGTPVTTTSKPQTKYGWGKLKKSEKKFQEQLANMSVPPTFVPPGLSRVPTPPMFDQAGEVKGKLADFFFEMPGQLDNNRKQQRPRMNSPGGVWDSDALLMPMGGIITPPSSSNESAPPLSAQPTPNPTEHTQELSNSTPNFPYRNLSPHPTPLPSSPPAHANYFRVHFDEDATPDQEMEEEERAKFEWLIPEHLPSSPLCPLHAKYRGPSKGVCVYHGRKRSEARALHAEGSGDSPKGEKPDFDKRTKRRLASFTSP